MSNIFYYMKSVVHGLDTSAQGNFWKIPQISLNYPPVPM